MQSLISCSLVLNLLLLLFQHHPYCRWLQLWLERVWVSAEVCLAQIMPMHLVQALQTPDRNVSASQALEVRSAAKTSTNAWVGPATTEAAVSTRWVPSAVNVSPGFLVSPVLRVWKKNHFFCKTPGCNKCYSFERSASLFPGRLCEVNINDCAGRPCPPGTVCYDKINTFVCR